MAVRDRLLVEMLRSRICSLSVGIRSSRALLTSIENSRCSSACSLHLGLDEDARCFSGSSPAASQSIDHLVDVGLEPRRVLVAGRQHVPVGDHVEVLPPVVLEPHPVLERADVVAEMEPRRWAACRRGCVAGLHSEYPSRGRPNRPRQHAHREAQRRRSRTIREVTVRATSIGDQRRSPSNAELLERDDDVAERQEAHQHPRAVERRNRDQVEQPERAVEHHAGVAHRAERRPEPGLRRDAREGGEQRARARTFDAGPASATLSWVVLRALQVRPVDRHRLRPSRTAPASGTG